MKNTIVDLMYEIEGDDVFFVEVDTAEYDTWGDLMNAVDEIVEENFGCATLLGLYDKETADELGYDTY